MERDNRISAIRMMAMLSIVACHILQYYGNVLAWWFNLGVQVFFAVSGFLYGGRKVKDPLRFIIKGWIKVLLPCFVFLCAVLPCLFYFGDLGLNLKTVIRVFSFQRLPAALHHLWFIEYILFCYCMIPFLDLLKNSFTKMSRKKAVSVGVIMSCGYAVTAQVCHFRFLPAWIICFVLGYYLSFVRNQFGEKSFNQFSIVLMVSGAIALLLRICGDSCIADSNKVVSLAYGFALPYLRAVIGVGIFVGLYHILKCRNSVVLRVSDRYAFEIYIVHHIFIFGPLSVMECGAAWMLLCVWGGAFYVPSCFMRLQDLSFLRLIIF